MSEAIIVAIITGGLSLIGVIVSNNRTAQSMDKSMDAKLDKQTLTDIAAHALGTVERWGFYAMLYTGLYFARDNLYMTGAALKPSDVWLAAYRSTKPDPGWPFGMWQYTSKGKIPGVVDAIPDKVSGVDLSVPYKDYTKIIAKKGLTRLREGA